VSLFEGCEPSQLDLVGVAGNHLCLDLLDLDGEAFGGFRAGQQVLIGPVIVRNPVLRVHRRLLALDRQLRSG
jgi:hypothetical protein